MPEYGTMTFRRYVGDKILESTVSRVQFKTLCVGAEFFMEDDTMVTYKFKKCGPNEGIGVGNKGNWTVPVLFFHDEYVKTVSKIVKEKH